jgi:RHH-type transcriptional regulator, rel operon repressor / antitoxin RelB
MRSLNTRALQCNALQHIKAPSMSTTVKDSQVSLRLPAGLKDQMETYAQLTGRTKSYVAMEALTEYLAWRIPQIEDLKEAIAAADRADFATEAEAEAVLGRYSAPEVKPRPSTRTRVAAASKRK